MREKGTMRSTDAVGTSTKGVVRAKYTEYASSTVEAMSIATSSTKNTSMR